MVKTQMPFKRGTFLGDFLLKLVPHHRQGELDGACGFFCVSMILDYFELCNPALDVRNPETKLSRWLRTFDRKDLLNEGLTEPEIHTVASHFTSKKMISSFAPHSSFRAINNWIYQHCAEGVPAILMFRPENGVHHYAVTVGTGAKRIFLMDPAADAPEVTLYNGWLSYQGRGVISDNYGVPIVELGPCSVVYQETLFIGEEWRLPR